MIKMIKDLNEYVKIKELRYDTSLDIINYFGEKGQIRGHILLKQEIMNLVELDNYNRIWIMRAEAEFL
uniref:Uncharacterized protein n=1 Tax=Sporolithon durum TaxID=48970 RepID=A0A141SCQ3_9FLOR|nr:hypothetical protein Sdur_010 [Sporolithon durum]AMK96071.1 hypothetical protein Sdur_010 [Sporolithon durum]